MKGIILAGGSGTRLWPCTRSISKQILPVYDKPLIYYPLSTLMLAGIREILIITTPESHDVFTNLLGDGSQIGLNLSYAIQVKPNGLAEAFMIGETFIGDESVVLILGDNIFHGNGFGRRLKELQNLQGAIIFGLHVKDPERYGIAEIDARGAVVSIEEKPNKPKSHLAIPGLYFFDNSVVKKSKKVGKSNRGELEITSILEMYMREGQLELKSVDRGTSWMDCGTFDSLNDASNYVRAIEERQGLKIACIEEIALKQGWISNRELLQIAQFLGANEYADYLFNLVQQ
jgi:glucose-1-phosphate thymidylyltransferase